MNPSGAAPDFGASSAPVRSARPPPKQRPSSTPSSADAPGTTRSDVGRFRWQKRSSQQVESGSRGNLRDARVGRETTGVGSGEGHTTILSVSAQIGRFLGGPTRPQSLVPIVPVGTPSGTLRVHFGRGRGPPGSDDAERRRRHSHGDRGNEGNRALLFMKIHHVAAS